MLEPEPKASDLKKYQYSSWSNGSIRIAPVVPRSLMLSFSLTIMILLPFPIDLREAQSVAHATLSITTSYVFFITMRCFLCSEEVETSAW
ncbi:Os11g0474450 [Oryza sativa Japonica Group]|uniref:Os11g0474450 protein n=1 Tax=Oryza sativa subsp. japonica TaxID=39947 RepID=A0A0P0Y296_ORYSJ|nr:Os11g0474450 [Oryza sativa Japonica Group]